jgi:hypothetical protein
MITEERKSYMRDYYHRNKEKMDARTQKWREQNKEQNRENNRDYYARNKEIILARNRKSYADNPEKQEYHRKYRAEQAFLYCCTEYLQTNEAG